jgi:hypothetical protein
MILLVINNQWLDWNKIKMDACKLNQIKEMKINVHAVILYDTLYLL